MTWIPPKSGYYPKIAPQHPLFGRAPAIGALDVGKPETLPTKEMTSNAMTTHQARGGSGSDRGLLDQELARRRAEGEQAKRRVVIIAPVDGYIYPKPYPF